MNPTRYSAAVFSGIVAATCTAGAIGMNPRCRKTSAGLDRRINARSPSGAAPIGVAPDLWQLQDRFLGAYSRLAESAVMDPALRATFGKLAVGLKVGEDLVGWRP